MDELFARGSLRRGGKVGLEQGGPGPRRRTCASLIGVDASVLANAFLANAFADDGDDGRKARERLTRDVDLIAPRPRGRRNGVGTAKAQARGSPPDATVLEGDRRPGRSRPRAVPDVAADAPGSRASSQCDLLERCWALRSNMTTHDAAYVALAELIDATLLTADARLAATPGPTCLIEVLS